jgi:hypothetical protein
MFAIENGLKKMVVSTLISNFGLEYTISMVQTKEDGFKLNGTHHCLVYNEDFKILGGSLHNVKKIYHL